MTRLVLIATLLAASATAAAGSRALRSQPAPTTGPNRVPARLYAQPRPVSRFGKALWFVGWRTHNVRHNASLKTLAANHYIHGVPLLTLGNKKSIRAGRTDTLALAGVHGAEATGAYLDESHGGIDSWTEPNAEVYEVDNVVIDDANGVKQAIVSHLENPYALPVHGVARGEQGQLLLVTGRFKAPLNLATANAGKPLEPEIREQLRARFEEIVRYFPQTWADRVVFFPLPSGAEVYARGGARVDENPRPAGYDKVDLRELQRKAPLIYKYLYEQR